ncbi:MAG TPA: hypothetical protein VGE98_02345, partial [Thermoanaerobaculia bacterium]
MTYEPFIVEIRREPSGDLEAAVLSSPAGHRGRRVSALRSLRWSSTTSGSRGGAPAVALLAAAAARMLSP